MIDHYKVLQVARNASQEVIQAAFLARNNSIQKDFANDAKKLHLLSIILLNAYNTLSDPEKRRQLDVQLSIEDVKEKISQSANTRIAKAEEIHSNFDARIEPTFSPSDIKTNNPQPVKKSQNKISKYKFHLTFIFLVLLSYFAYSNQSKIKAYINNQKTLIGNAETTTTKNVSNQNQAEKKTPAINPNNNKESQKKLAAPTKKPVDNFENNITSHKKSIEDINSDNLKAQAERERALEIEKNQMIAAQKLRCDKAKLHYANSQNRLNTVRSSYQNKINEIENDIQSTAFASLALAFKDKRALSEGANINRPKEELQRQLRSRMNDEVSVMETELEQFRISNLECFR